MTSDAILPAAEVDRLRGVIAEAAGKLAAHDEAIIDQAREAGGVYTLHYWRYFQEYSDNYLTLEEAVDAAQYGEDAGEMSARSISGPRGATYTPGGQIVTPEGGLTNEQ